MANPEHLMKLKEGVAKWNFWRKENCEIKPDLTRANLQYADLTNANFIDTDLKGANLTRANLTRASLSRATLSGAGLTEADLTEATLTWASLSEANLSEANLPMADLREANLTMTALGGANLSGARLGGANLSRASLPKADFGEANLSGARLGWANLREASLGRANLSGANLHKADLSGADLPKADFSGANLSGARLGGANFSEANLHKADLSGADLSGSNLLKANLNMTNLTVVWLAFTSFTMVNLSTVKGLETCRHVARSSLDTHTLDMSPNLPEIFLRGCGLSDKQIQYLPSVFHEAAFQYYSCFISYSTKDQAFAERLYNDLQGAGVRCWFAPEDMAGGKILIDQIDSAIRLHDKLLLVLSEHSMKSKWVQTELKRTLKTEGQQGNRKLYPLGLASIKSIQAWECFDATAGEDLADKVREYFIPDFTNWEANVDYQKAFQRLLKDLKEDNSNKEEQAQ